MILQAQQTRLTKFLAIGIFLISIAVSTEGFTDPVNVPKFVILGVVALGALGFISRDKINTFSLGQNYPVISLLIFNVFALFAVIQSDSPMSQNLYGAYGRNNGFLTYLFLSFLLLLGCLIRVRGNHLILLKSLLYVGYVNLAYCLWVIIFGDFVPWSNPYGNILGTFGNPNFIGAFFGIFFGVLISLGLGSEATRKFRLFLLPLIPLTLFEIINSHAIQGRVLVGFSLAIVGFYFLRYRVKTIYLSAYSLVIIILGGLALAGAFQKGPLTDLIYKTSVSLRGQYWLAAWNTGQSHPISGVGMDGFGDWYRRSRDVRAITLPGVDTVVNAAHNVPLDMFAFGGWPLFISYILIVGLAFKSALSISRKMKSYDAVGVGLITAWACYQLQSIISINQIGLATWGWLLSGLLIGYENYLKIHAVEPESVNEGGQKRRSKRTPLDPKTFVTVGGLAAIGLILALPPGSADMKLRSAQVSQDAQKVEQTMQGSYFNPQNMQKYMLNIQALETSGLFDLSRKYSLEATSWNPQSYDLWRVLYLIKNSTQEEKLKAIQMMKKLDPLNPTLNNLK